MGQIKISISVIPQEFAIHRLKPTARIPLHLLDKEEIFHISRTEDELSIVCNHNIQIPSDQVSKYYKCLKILGPLDFDMVGVISKIANILKGRDIPIFVISTFDTDYILINKDNAIASIEALREDEYISLTNVSNSH